MPATAVSMIEPVRSRQWARSIVEVHVPDSAHTITIGMALLGDGAACFGELDLESD